MAINRILLAIDGSTYSRHAVKAAHGLCGDRIPEVAAIFVLDSAHLSGNPEAGIMPHDAELALRKEAESDLRYCEQIWNSSITAFLRRGKPAEEILKACAEWQADLVVLGTHGRTGLKHLLMGSVAESVLRGSAIPVLIIPMK